MTNQETFHQYVAEMRVNERSEATIDTDRLAVGKLMEFLGSKPFQEANKQDILEFFAEITPGYKSSYVHLLKRRIKHFYAWLYNLERGQYPPSVRWLKSYNPQTKVKGIPTTVSPEKVLTEEDARQYIEACDHPRDAAMVSLLYELGPEANELLALKVGNVLPDEYGAKVTLEGTGGVRTLRIVDSLPYIQEWLRRHPSKHDKTAPLWTVKKGPRLTAMSYSTLYRMLKKLHRITGIKKPFSPKWWRHACLTKMAKVLPEQLLKKFAGWKPDSPMAGIYVHLASQDVDEAVLGLHGVPIERPQAPLKESPLSPITCPRCQHENPATARYCALCGMVVSKREAFNMVERERKGLADIIRDETRGLLSYLESLEKPEATALFRDFIGDLEREVDQAIADRQRENHEVAKAIKELKRMVEEKLKD